MAFAGEEDVSTLYRIEAATGLATALGAVSGLSQINSLAPMPDGQLMLPVPPRRGCSRSTPNDDCYKIASTDFTAGGDLQYVGNHLYMSDSSGNVLEVALSGDGSIRTDALGNASTMWWRA
ncbi:hypothetical protein [Salinicola tamaricis]|uniref:hypothetical protein n=1 Tax=Salinicola tamaricis TaxID=1771309 RepID=UPI0013EC5CD1|nr:hypothetical protein [Salinicola tamaricis]